VFSLLTSYIERSGGACDQRISNLESLALVISRIPDGESMGKVVEENLGQVVRRIVRQKGLKLRDIEQRSGGEITNSYVSKIVNGNTRSLTVEKLLALAQGLDADPHVLFTAACERAPLSTRETGAEVPDAEWLLETMQRVLGHPELVSILRELMNLRPEEYPIFMKYLTVMNKKKHKQQSRTKRPRGK
jgi:transcriptional regulator with XRE-family HTH domain